MENSIRMSAMSCPWNVALAIVLVGAVPPGALAAGYPERPIRLIVPSPPGGGTDASTRMITPKLGEVLGQQIVVDNRGGASQSRR